MTYVSKNAATLTPCGAVPSDKACVQEYLLSFAEKAFRHPLSVEEQSAITGQFWAEMTAAGATLAEALGYGVYGVLSSPSFIYRTELGADVADDGPLTPYELATRDLRCSSPTGLPTPSCSPPRPRTGSRTPDQVRAQATRLLETPEARANLESALIKYFSLTKAPTVILNPEVTPGLTVTAGMESSIFHEGELFMKNLLWSGPLDELLTSRQTWTSAAIATQIYGVAAPTEVDADGFGPVELAGRSLGPADALDVPARRRALDRRLAGRPRAGRERARSCAR